MTEQELFPVNQDPLTKTGWFEALQKASIYKHLDLMVEWEKMVHWCAANRAKPSRKRFVNWINRIPQPRVVDYSKGF